MDSLVGLIRFFILRSAWFCSAHAALQDLSQASSLFIYQKVYYIHIKLNLCCKFEDHATQYHNRHLLWYNEDDSRLGNNKNWNDEHNIKILKTVFCDLVHVYFCESGSSIILQYLKVTRHRLSWVILTINVSVIFTATQKRANCIAISIQ